MQKTCIIIPCYNEASRLDPAAFCNFLQTQPNFFFLFFDDGSRDETFSILQKLNQSDPKQIMIFRRTENKGKGESIREGVLLAMQWQQFDHYGYLDADLATPLSQLPLLLYAIQMDPKTEIVFGSRKKTAANFIERNALRHVLGRIYTVFLTTILGLKIYDTQCGVKIIRGETAKKIFDRPFIDKWLFDIEIFCRIREHSPDFKKAYIEYVLDSWVEKGDSRIKLTDLLTLPIQTVRLLLRYN